MVKLALAQNPSKSYQAGERQFEKVLLIYQYSPSLSVGKAIWDILRQYPEFVRQDVMPMCQNHLRGLEVTYEEFPRAHEQFYGNRKDWL